MTKRSYEDAFNGFGNIDKRPNITLSPQQEIIKLEALLRRGDIDLIKSISLNILQTLLQKAENIEFIKAEAAAFLIGAQENNQCLAISEILINIGTLNNLNLKDIENLIEGPDVNGYTKLLILYIAKGIELNKSLLSSDFDGKDALTLIKLGLIVDRLFEPAKANELSNLLEKITKYQKFVLESLEFDHEYHKEHPSVKDVDSVTAEEFSPTHLYDLFKNRFDNILKQKIAENQQNEQDSVNLLELLIKNLKQTGLFNKNEGESHSIGEEIFKPSYFAQILAKEGGLANIINTTSNIKQEKIEQEEEKLSPDLSSDSNNSEQQDTKNSNIDIDHSLTLTSNNNINQQNSAISVLDNFIEVLPPDDINQLYSTEKITNFDITANINNNVLSDTFFTISGPYNIFAVPIIDNLVNQDNPKQYENDYQCKYWTKESSVKLRVTCEHINCAARKLHANIDEAIKLLQVGNVISVYDRTSEIYNITKRIDRLIKRIEDPAFVQTFLNMPDEQGQNALDKMNPYSKLCNIKKLLIKYGGKLSMCKVDEESYPFNYVFDNEPAAENNQQEQSNKQQQHIQENYLELDRWNTSQINNDVSEMGNNNSIFADLFNCS